jgi:hypothetical protein
MNKDVNLKDLNLKALKTKANKFISSNSKHAVFGALLLVLLVYLFVVFRINQLATADPPADAVSSAKPTVRINEDAIKQIQTLENNNPQVHSLFNEARNNPFQE